jgi:hypothetical protein
MILLGDKAQVDAWFSSFDIVLILTQDRCMVCAERTKGSEIILDALMVLLGDKAQVDAWFSSFGDSANLDARQVHDLRWTYHSLRNHFGHTRWNSKVTWVMWNLVLVHLEILLVFVQNRCMICAKHTVGSEIVLDAPDSTPRWECQVDAWPSSFDIVLILTQDRCTVCAERTKGSKIILDAPDGTLRWRGASGSSVQSVRR